MKKDIDIIAPGSSKYKYGMINSVFRVHREIFNDLISDSRKNYSIFIYGYGFNDDHFNAVFQDTTKDVLVLTKMIKSCFLERALKNNNWTIFYKDEENKQQSSDSLSYMVYKGKKYALQEDIWDINVFSELFLG